MGHVEAGDGEVERAVGVGRRAEGLGLPFEDLHADEDARPGASESARPRISWPDGALLDPLLPHQAATLEASRIAVLVAAESDRRRARGGQAPGRLRRQEEVAEQQVGEERRLGGDQAEHAPPADARWPCGADRQRLGVGPGRQPRAVSSMRVAARRWAPARSRSRRQRQRAADAGQPPEVDAAAPANATVRPSASSNGARLSAGIRRISVGLGVEGGGAERLAAVVEQRCRSSSTERPVSWSRRSSHSGWRLATIGMHREVVGRRRRGDRPFQRRRVPRIGAGGRAARAGCTATLIERAAARRPRTANAPIEMIRLASVPAHAGGIGVDAPRHAQQAERGASGRSRG